MFFILAHYVTDAHMPLHCDMRDYDLRGCEDTAGRILPGELHGSIEELWENNFPPQKDIILNKYLTKSIRDIVLQLPAGSIIRIDKDDKYKLSPTISGIIDDEWYEMVYIARTSYAVSMKLIDAPFKDAKELVAKKGEDFNHVTNCIFHDAVESVARLWIKAWDRFTGQAHSSAIHPSNTSNVIMAKS